jgi:hypothetical protein
VFVPRYSEREARTAIAASTNWSQALRLLGLRAAGGNHRVLKRWALTWGIATDHFVPYAHVGAHLQKPRIALEAVLVEGSNYTRSSLKQRLYEAGLKTRACEACGQGELWRGLRMSLILDHINGVHDDNRLANLRILCPNCAATLPTHCSRNLPKKVCPTCGEEFRKGGRRQRFCSQRCWQRSPECKAAKARAGRPRVERPSYEQLLADLAELPWVAVGAKYGVSDNAVRKWVRRYEAERSASSSVAA